MIEIKQLTKRYGKCVALDHVDLKLPRGEIVGLFGENGAGKTTLIKSILNLVRYDGAITLDGAPIDRSTIAKLSFATCEHSFFPGLNPRDHALFYEDHFPTFSRQRFEGLMDFFDLPMGKALRAFSTGQKNQFEVIMALSQGADYILMDEPFAGSDIFNRDDFYKVLLGILEPHETVLLSTHLIQEVAGFIGRAVLIRRGRIVGDVTVDELEEAGTNLIDYIRDSYDRPAHRVARALEQITGDREEEG